MEHFLCLIRIKCRFGVFFKFLSPLFPVIQLSLPFSLELFRLKVWEEDLKPVNSALLYQKPLYSTQVCKEKDKIRSTALMNWTLRNFLLWQKKKKKREDLSPNPFCSQNFLGTSGPAFCNSSSELYPINQRSNEAQEQKGSLHAINNLIKHLKVRKKCQGQTTGLTLEAAGLFISTVPKYLLRGDEASELSAQGEADGKIKLCKVMEKRIPWRGHLGMCGNHWDRDEQGIVVPAWSLWQK